MAPLTSDDVLNVKFQVSSFKEGYNQDEVDEFLDEVTTTIRGLEERLGTGPGTTTGSHQRTEILLTSQDVRNIRFKTSKFREGYEQPAVDAFLDAVVATLETMEARLKGSVYGARARTDQRPGRTGPPATPPGQEPSRQPSVRWATRSTRRRSPSATSTSPSSSRRTPTCAPSSRPPSVAWGRAGTRTRQR